jgi:hypothetical protein
MQRFTALVLLLLSACSAPPPRPASPRAEWLRMFARGCVAGRSGDVFLVPREGDILTGSDAHYRFMHGTPWDCDARLPLLLHGAPFIRAGRYAGAASQEDIAPTLAALLGTALPTATGRILQEALTPDAGRPRLVVVLVADGLRADALDRHADAVPTLLRLRDEGAWFTEARIDVLPTLTAAGHANIGTGTEPRFHGIGLNTTWDRSAGRTRSMYDADGPRELRVPTLADAWSAATGGEAVILALGGATRATVGLVGHGACQSDGLPVLAASYDAATSGWKTDEACFTLPEALRDLRASGSFFEPGSSSADFARAEKDFRASPRFEAFEEQSLLAALRDASLGQDEVTDLVLVNLKGPDFVGHAEGPDSPAMRETLAELDAFVARLLDLLDAWAGPGESVLVLTADHGMPGEPAPGRRHDIAELRRMLNEQLDPGGPGVIAYYGDPADAQMFLDEGRVAALGLSARDVAAWLETLDFIAAAFTADEVRAAQARLDGGDEMR